MQRGWGAHALTCVCPWSDLVVPTVLVDVPWWYFRGISRVFESVELWVRSPRGWRGLPLPHSLPPVAGLLRPTGLRHWHTHPAPLPTCQLIEDFCSIRLEFRVLQRVVHPLLGRWVSTGVPQSPDSTRNPSSVDRVGKWTGRTGIGTCWRYVVETFTV